MYYCSVKKILLILLCLPIIGFGQDDNIVGEWINKGKGYENTLLLKKIKENVYSFSFYGYRYSYDHFLGDTTKFLGEMSNSIFTIEIIKNKAYYNDDIQEFEEGWEIYRDGEDRCDVYFEFRKKSILVKTEFCSFIYGGFGVSFDGEYKKTNSQ